MKRFDKTSRRAASLGGRPTIRGMRIAVADVLGWLASRMTHEEILSDYPELTEADIRAASFMPADRECRLVTATP